MDGEPPDPWDLPPDPGEPSVDIDPEAATGAYRGRRRAAEGRRTRLVTVASVTATVGAMLVGSGVVVRSLSSPETVPVVPPSVTPALSPSPSPFSPPPPIDEPSPDTGLGTAPEPSPTPSSSGPSPAPSQSPPEPSPESPSPPPVSLVFEAESADRGGDTDVEAAPGASGGAVVDLDGRGEWCLVRFSGVTVDRPGRYDLAIDYLSAWQDTVAWVSVNDGWPEAVGFPETSGNSIATRTVPVDLEAGDNLIVISSPQCDDAPRLDRITVTG